MNKRKLILASNNKNFCVYLTTYTYDDRHFSLFFGFLSADKKVDKDKIVDLGYFSKAEACFLQYKILKLKISEKNFEDLIGVKIPRLREERDNLRQTLEPEICIKNDILFVLKALQRCGVDGISIYSSRAQEDAPAELQDCNFHFRSDEDGRFYSTENAIYFYKSQGRFGETTTNRDAVKSSLDQTKLDLRQSRVLLDFFCSKLENLHKKSRAPATELQEAVARKATCQTIEDSQNSELPNEQESKNSFSQRLRVPLKVNTSDLQI